MIETIHASSVLDLIEILPAMLGYTPTESLVVMAFEGSLSGPIARVDISALRDPVTLRHLGNQLSQHGDRAFVFAYTDRLDRDDMVNLLWLGSAALRIEQVYRVHDGQWEDMLDDGTGAVPSTGAAAPFIAQGMVQLPNRQAIVDLFAPTQPVDLPEVNPLPSQIADAWRAFFESTWDVDTLAVMLHWDKDLRDTILAYLGADHELTADDAAYIKSLPVLDPAEKAEALRRLSVIVSDDALGAADLVCATAFAYYFIGSGTHANIAVDRALSINPDHRLSQLLVILLANGIKPPTVRDQS